MLTIASCLHDNKDPEKWEGPVSNAVVVVEVPPEPERVVSEHYEDHEHSSENQGVCPHTVLIYKYCIVTGRNHTQ